MKCLNKAVTTGRDISPLNITARLFGERRICLKTAELSVHSFRDEAAN